MQRFDLGHLEVLQILLEEESVSRAAERLHLSPSAVSRSLAKIRLSLQDEVLVPSGRNLILTQRGRDLKDRIKKIVDESRVILSPQADFGPARMKRVFRIRTGGDVTNLMGENLLKAVSQKAPFSALVFLTQGDEDQESLRNGKIDCDIGAPGNLGPEFISQTLFSFRYVSALMRKLKTKSGRMSLDAFCSYPHIVVSRRGKTFVLIDEELRKRGRQRIVLGTVATFQEAFVIASHMECIVVAPDVFVSRMKGNFKLASSELPFSTPPVNVALTWHPRYQSDPEHRWFRELIKTCPDTGGVSR
ncbi:MAG: LysR family transcriptional regulator [Syntrophorhabdales bacterium]